MTAKAAFNTDEWNRAPRDRSLVRRRSLEDLSSAIAGNVV